MINKTSIFYNSNNLSPYRLISIFLIFTLLIFIPKLATPEDSVEIKKIIIKGNKKIETNTIIHHIKNKVGDKFSPWKLRDDLMSIYKLGFFQDIQIDVETFEGGITVTFIVIERPIIRELIFQGNEKLDEEKIKEKVKSAIGSIVSKTTLEEDVVSIKIFYSDSGYYLADISYQIDKINEATVKVMFNIKEGRKIYVRRIIFEGNEVFPDEILEGQLSTKIKSLFSFLTSSGVLKKDQFEQDMDSILDFYNNHGYIQAKAYEPEVKINEDKQEMYIVIPIYEGEQYSVGEISVQGNTIFTTEEIIKDIFLKTGDIYNRGQLRQDINKLEEKYAEKGYIFVNAVPLITEDKKKEKIVNIAIEIHEGEVVFVDRIEIKGNNKTRDKVIRRELKVMEGDIFDSVNLKRSIQQLNNLGYFEKVDIKPQIEDMSQNDDGENELTLLIDVLERNTNTISVGLGYSSVDRLFGTFDFTIENLFGLGQRFNLAAQVGTKRQTYNVSFTEPYLFDTQLAMGTDIYYKIDENRSYTVSRRGGDLRLGYPVAEYVKFNYTYLYETVEVFDLLLDVSEAIRNASGVSVTSSQVFSLARDTRDNRLLPMSGSRNRLSYEYAGGYLGGDNYFYKTYFDSNWYIPIKPISKKLTFSFHSQIAYAGGHSGRSLPLFEKFKAGGATTIRGFREDSIGPRDEEGITIGGDKRLIFNTELYYPVYGPLTLAVFFDAGNVYSSGESYNLSSLRYGTGMGMRVNTPLGPVKLDYGYNLNKEDYEPSTRWHFTIGSYF
ncbi:MAG: outer membrane protein assembly factor BamA [bacterium]